MTKHELDLSRKPPIQLEFNELGCPYCMIPLIPGKVEMYYKQKPIGYFDGLKCNLCNYGLFTEQGCIDSENVIKYGTQTSSNEIVNLLKFGEMEFKGSFTNDVSELRMDITTEEYRC